MAIFFISVFFYSSEKQLFVKLSVTIKGLLDKEGGLHDIGLGSLILTIGKFSICFTGAHQQSQQRNCQLAPSYNYPFIHISCFLLIYSNMKQRLMICIKSKNKKIFRKKQAKNTGGVHFFHQQRKCMSTDGAPGPPLFGKRTGLAAYRTTINMR